MSKKLKHPSLPEEYEIIAIRDSDYIPTIKSSSGAPLQLGMHHEFFALGDMYEVQLPMDLFSKISEGAAELLFASERAIKAVNTSMGKAH